MEENNLSALIDDFLLGKIQPSDLDTLNALRKSDAKFDLRVRESIMAFELLRYLRYKELRSRLAKLDDEDKIAVSSAWSKKWIIWLLFFATGFIASVFWARHYYDASVIADRFLFNDISDLHLASSPATSLFNEGLKSFQQKQFARALLQFHSVLENPDPPLEAYARWNAMLSEFVLNGDKALLEHDLLQFQSNPFPGSNLKSKELNHLIHSPFFTLFNQVINPQLSLLKPRML